MQPIGQAGLDSIAARIHRAENCDDSAAKPLKPGRVTSRGNQAPGYPDYKMQRFATHPRLDVDRPHHALAKSEAGRREPSNHRLYRPAIGHDRP
jgi:hypothetical protein